MKNVSAICAIFPNNNLKDLKEIAFFLAVDSETNFKTAFCFKQGKDWPRQGRSQTFFLGGATGGASFATRGAVNGLCRTFRMRPEKFWRATGGARQNFWGAVAILAPTSSAPGPRYPHSSRGLKNHIKRSVTYTFLPSYPDSDVLQNLRSVNQLFLSRRWNCFLHAGEGSQF